MTAARTELGRSAAPLLRRVGLYDVLYVLFMLSGRTVIGPALNVLFPDFLVFHAAARACFEGKLALVYDIDAFTASRTRSMPTVSPARCISAPSSIRRSGC